MAGHVNSYGFMELLLFLKVPSIPLWHRRKSMPDFLQGIIAALLPSMLTVAWFVWQATPVRDLDPLDQHHH
jgi:hypothetical protein